MELLPGPQYNLSLQAMKQDLFCIRSTSSMLASHSITRGTVTVNLAFSGVESQAIDLKEIGPELFNKVDIYVDLIDDTTADGDLYEHLVTNTETLSFNGKTIADYGITDAYTKDEVDAKIPTKVSQLQNDAGYLTQHQDISGKADKSYVDELVGDIEDLLADV